VKKLLILGRGQIGSALASDLTEYDVHVWAHDIDDLTSEALDVIAPDAVINAAGKTHLAWCEENAREALRTNVEAPVRLYDKILHSEKPIQFVHFSSGCIWDGPYTKSGKPFTPDVPPTPACLYSWTKAAADAMLMDRDPMGITILRPRQVYSSSPSPRNTLVKLLHYPKLVDTPNSVSSMTVIEKTLRYALENDASGIWNVYDKGVMTPFEIGELLTDAGMRDKPLRISKDELDAFHTPKRVDTVLYDERFERLVHPEEVHRVLSQTIEELKMALVAESMPTLG